MRWKLNVPRGPSATLPTGPWDADTVSSVQQQFEHCGLLVSRRDPRIATHSLDDAESTELARNLFLAYDGLAAGSVGGHRTYSVRDRDALERLQLAMHVVCRLARRSPAVTAPSATPAVHLPSGWHAALWLTLAELEARAGGKQLAYRGQVDSRWVLAPSWTRVAHSDRHTVLRRRHRFEGIVASVASQLGFTLDATMCRAISQHHGLTSRLLDLTSDPIIAIWFALNGGDGRVALQRAVWYRDVQALIGSGCRVIIPPPFLRRLHAQRGFFVERRADASDLNTTMHLVTFDGHDTATEFQPIWLGDVRPVYPGVRWIETLAREVAMRDEPLLRASVRQALFAEIFELAQSEMVDSLANGPFTISTDRTLPLHAGPWSNETYGAIGYDVLYRLAIIMDQQGNRIHLPTIRAIVRRNPSVISRVINYIRQPPDGQALATVDLQLASVLDQFLLPETSLPNPQSSKGSRLGDQCRDRDKLKSIIPPIIGPKSRLPKRRQRTGP